MPPNPSSPGGHGVRHHGSVAPGQHTTYHPPVTQHSTYTPSGRAVPSSGGDDGPPHARPRPPAAPPCVVCHPPGAPHGRGGAKSGPERAPPIKRERPAGPPR